MLMPGPAIINRSNSQNIDLAILGSNGLREPMDGLGRGHIEFHELNLGLGCV